jgi:FkbM family methyltransferase
MTLLHKFQSRIANYREFYGFQKWGMPAVKDEKISKSILKKHLPANPVMIDCGAHDGGDSIELVRIIGGSLHAFEPVPEIYKRLVAHTGRYPSIRTYPVALSNKSGKDFIYKSEGASDGSSSLLAPKAHLTDHVDTYFKEKIEIATMTLDDWARANKVEHVDLLWLDMQGFEMMMLQASTVILPTVKAIHTEISVKETYEGVSLYRDYKSFLESIGFRVVVEAMPAGWDMGNVVFVR